MDPSVIDDLYAGEAEVLEAMFRRSAADCGVEMDFLCVSGDPALTIANVGRTVQASVIAVGKPTSVKGRLWGSVAKRLIARNETSVVVVVP